MPRISEDRRTDRRRQIAEAAERCFKRKGFDATSVADIIAESGLSAGALYVHFENKMDIVRHVVAEVVAERAADLSTLPDRVPLPDPEQVVREYVDRLDSGIGAELRLHTWTACLRDPQLKATFGEYAARTVGLYELYVRAWLGTVGLDAAEVERRARPLATLIVGICQGYTVHAALSAEPDPDAYLAGISWLDFHTHTTHQAPGRHPSDPQTEEGTS